MLGRDPSSKMCPSVNIQPFVACNNYMFSVILSKIMLEFCYIFFSLRMGKYAKFSFANMSFANLPSFPAAKVFLYMVCGFFIFCWL